MTTEDEHAGKVVSCPACNGRFQVPALPATAKRKASIPSTSGPQAAPAQGQAEDQGERGGWHEEDHANINFFVSLGIATIVTAVFLFALLPFHGNYFSDIFLKRGWVNYAEIHFFIWGFVIIFMKWKRTQRQRRAMMLDIVPAKLGSEINTHSVGGFIDHIYKLPTRLRDSLMVNRIRKGLELFEKRNSNGEVAAFLGSQSDIDANRISGSYTLLKVFLWAIPILGFIGTVQGLSTAVSSLSAGSTDPEALKASINNLTGGLGVAFDTTLLGLILSMILSFPMAIMQKEEEAMLTEIDAFCTEKLLPKLNDSKSTTDDLLKTQAENIPAFAASLSRAHEVFLVKLQEASVLLRDAGDVLKTRLDTHQSKVESTFEEAVQKLASQTKDSFAEPTKQLNGYFSALNQGVESLNALLKQLGGQTIVIQKKGFFSR
ncbi:MAG: MotA/TolQ/ExbB proton channel family protein [Verrucomicrobiales bacterium]